VEDSGEGIAPNRLESVFETSDQAPARGESLSLPLSKQLVELMGGEMKAENVAAGGARFSFEVGLRIVDKGEAASETAPEPISESL
jgi:signal transduction histidine kinase